MYVIKCLGKNDMYYKNGWNNEGVVNFSEDIKDAYICKWPEANQLVNDFNKELDGNYQVVQIYSSKEEAWSDFHEYGSYNFITAEIDEMDMCYIQDTFYDGFENKNENQYANDNRKWIDGDGYEVTLKDIWSCGESYGKYYLC